VRIVPKLSFEAVITPRDLLKVSAEPEMAVAVGNWLNCVAKVGVSPRKLLAFWTPLCKAVGISQAKLVLLTELKPGQGGTV
jgi:hypothetical protein